MTIQRHARKRVLAGLVVAAFVASAIGLAATVPAYASNIGNSNETPYWEAQYPGTECFKDTGGTVVGKDVVLSVTNASVLIVNGGSNDQVYPNPVAGQTGYHAPLNNGGQIPDVSHYIYCSVKTPPPPTCDEGEVLVDNECTTPPPTCDEGEVLVDNECTTPPPLVECAYVGTSVTQSNRASDLSSTTVTLKEGFSFCDVSLNNYHTSGPTWATGNPQTFGDHDTVHLTAENPTGNLSVTQGLCYNQNDLYFGTTRFDGTDGALPHYPDSVTPTHLIDYWNGGSACAPVTIPVELCNRTDGYLNPDEGGLMPEQTPGGLLLDGPSLIHFPIDGYTLANLPDPSMVVEVTTGVAPFIKVETTNPYSTLNYFGGGLWGTTKIAYGSPGGMGNPVPAADLIGKWNYTSSTVPYSIGVGYANDTGNTATVKSLSFGGVTYDFVCVTKVTLGVPEKQDSCGTADDGYKLPADKEGVAFTREENGDITATLTDDSFTFDTLPDGWVDNGDGTATYAFENTEWSADLCVIEDVPGEGLFNDQCGVDNDTYTVGEVPEGAKWHFEVNGVPTNAGTYPAKGSVTIKAVPDDGYTFPEGVQTTWSHDFTNKACPTGLAFTGLDVIGEVLLVLGLVGGGLELKFGWFGKLIAWLRRKMVVPTPTA